MFSPVSFDPRYRPLRQRVTGVGGHVLNKKQRGVSKESPKSSTTLINWGLDSSKGRAPFGCPPKDCGWWPTAPLGGKPAPTLSRRFQGSGSQRVPLLMIIRWRRCCHKRRLEYRLMVRRRDPWGLRRVAREFGRTFRVDVKSRSILPPASGHRGNIKVLTWQGGGDRSRDPRFFV